LNKSQDLWMFAVKTAQNSEHRVQCTDCLTNQGRRSYKALVHQHGTA
jgi:hypothetical protein